MNRIGLTDYKSSKGLNMLTLKALCYVGGRGLLQYDLRRIKKGIDISLLYNDNS